MPEARRDHIVAVPPFFIFIIIAQIIVAIAVLGLAAYGATFDDWFGGNGFAIFCAIATFIINGYYLLTTLALPMAYNCWAFLVLECFLVVWWLSCWADLASWAAAYSFGLETCYVDVDNNFVCVGNDYKKYRDVMAAAAGIGALEWVLTIVTLAVFGIYTHRHRTSGAPYMMGGAWRDTQQNPQGLNDKAEPGIQDPYPAVLQPPQSFPMNEQSMYQQWPYQPQQQQGPKV
ncbi:hypothetical protein K432DRAFT_427851 [Lepidopterella palustris CBS 459.81]|uniref:MARVEL domain-containing protein n=1 Tax=Lepidopterella palustris CBS 459.81 TaxID=1314670 RepID=A0A8E2E5P4_9PEZI|nr:hypothetical protein K432DRAFT_427851 [Lepidopterella palustris CBS 459.81]